MHVDLLGKDDQTRALVKGLELLDVTVCLLPLDAPNLLPRLIPALLLIGSRGVYARAVDSGDGGAESGRLLVDPRAIWALDRTLPL